MTGQTVQRDRARSRPQGTRPLCSPSNPFTPPAPPPPNTVPPLRTPCAPRYPQHRHPPPPKSWRGTECGGPATVPCRRARQHPPTDCPPAPAPSVPCPVLRPPSPHRPRSPRNSGVWGGVGVGPAGGCTALQLSRGWCGAACVKGGPGETYPLSPLQTPGLARDGLPGGGGGCKGISRQTVIPSTDASKENTCEATFALMPMCFIQHKCY